ncbi:uracil-DNA glycosylase [Desulfotomaculum sp. 1211_IL3151]|uniref:uracil-DNA glycosylase n=1 Tax=Desulfotomaculum sp. 1211_IL3151 TaxID=3084055 RepID=UPI002FD88EC4
MSSSINKFIEELQKYKSIENVFNPWQDYDEICDICPEAPAIRSNHLEQFLSARIPGARYLLVAEAVGYQGGRFTGVAMTSERILLGNHAGVKPSVILQDIQGRRTSNPDNQKLKDTQKNFGFTEPTATIVWGEVIKSKVSPYQVITWNIFPFHPFDRSKGPLTNRTPTAVELEVGAYYTEMLLKLCPNITVISIGGHSSRTLSKFGIENIHVPHPANGGAGNFRAAIKNILV